MRTIKKRRREGKTDYKARIELLKGGIPRIVLRRSNRYFTAQYVKTEEARDKVIDGVNSIILLKYGWPEAQKGSLKSKIAGYLTGFLLGKRIIDREGKNVNVIFDTGLSRSTPKSRNYAFAKGLKESGVKIRCDEKMFPDIKSEKISIEKIKKEIEKI